MSQESISTHSIPSTLVFRNRIWHKTFVVSIAFPHKQFEAKLKLSLPHNFSTSCHRNVKWQLRRTGNVIICIRFPWNARPLPLSWLRKALAALGRKVETFIEKLNQRQSKASARFASNFFTPLISIHSRGLLCSIAANSCIFHTRLDGLGILSRYSRCIIFIPFLHPSRKLFLLCSVPLRNTLINYINLELNKSL